MLALRHFTHIRRLKRQLIHLRKLLDHIDIKNGAEADKDYDNPVAHGLQPTFILFPPLKDVVVAAVEDIQQGETSGRTGMAGVYLSIKEALNK
jgi:hypothetical protein